VERFAYKINTDEERFEVQLLFNLRAGSVIAFETAEWQYEFHIPFADFDEFVAKGKLRLNDFIHSQTVRPELFYASFDGVGDIVLVWPPFDEDWTGKQLTVEMDWRRPLIMSTFQPERYELDLRWTADKFAFVFDDSTRETRNFLGFIYDVFRDEHVGDCYQFFSCEHNDRLWGQTHVARLEFRVSDSCDNRDRRLRGRPQMSWFISGVWWKAFETDGRLVVECDERPHDRMSPILSDLITIFGEFTIVDIRQELKDVYPVTITLELSDVEES
jgi:hypothetical protein